MTHSVPTNGLQLLTEGLFDYAGMFPPASRTFEGALRESARFAKDLRRPYLVGSDMVIGSEFLPRLTRETLSANGYPPGRRLRVCVLASLGEIEQIASSADDNADIQIVSCECRVGRSDLLAMTEIERLIDPGLRFPLLCLEPDLSDEGWAEELYRVAGHCRLLTEEYEVRTALKVRCGGKGTARRGAIAAAVAHAADHNLHFKATAGLHHPVVQSKWNNDIGFIGLSMALLLRRSMGSEFPEKEIPQCLAEKQPKKFQLSESAGWRDWKVTLDQVRTIRTLFHFSIGSCSLQDPDGDLAKLFPRL